MKNTYSVKHMQFIGWVTALTVASLGALADEHMKEGAKQTLRGHIMPLQQYLSQGANQGADTTNWDASSSRDASSSVRPGTATQPIPINQQPGSVNRQPGSVNQPGTTTASGSQPRVGGTGERDQNPRTGGLTGQTGQSRNSALTGSISSSGDNEIMVLIATGHSDTAANAADPNRAQAEATRPEAYVAGRGTSTVTGLGQAYILICDPKDHATMASLSGYKNQSARSISTAPTPIAEQNANRDRLQVRDQVQNTDRSSSLGEREKNTANTTNQQNWNHGMKDEVKVTGKVLQRGGLQAIEVVSIEKVDAQGAKSEAKSPGTDSRSRTESDRRE